MPKMTKCPVCSMKTEEGYICSTYEGKVYSFCSMLCRETFEKDPAKFAKSGEHKGHSGC